MDVQSLAKATDIGAKLARNAALIDAAEASGAEDAHVVGNEVFVRPALGSFTSGFGARWGVMHYGIDIANAIGTPIYAFTDGVVEDAGPASGFGLWVVLRHPDGTHSVYGHVNRMFVQGRRAGAGGRADRRDRQPRRVDRARTCTSRCGPPDGTKINPLPWLASHGIRVS